MSSELRKRHNMVSSFSNFSDKVCSMVMLNGDVKGEELQDLSFFSMIGVYNLCRTLLNNIILSWYTFRK